MVCGITIHTGGLNPDRTILILLPAQLQFLTLPGFGNIANGQIGQPVLLVKLAGQEICDPLQIPAVVHMAVAIQVGKTHRALFFVFQHKPGEQL